MPDHGRGAMLSPPDSRDYEFTAHHYGAPAAGLLPAQVDLRGGATPTRQRPVGPVRNQGQHGSCVGHAGSELREALRVAAGAPFTRYSPLFTWWGARFREGSQAQDVGCAPRDALESMRADGTCPEQLDPYESGRYDVAPTPTMLAAAKRFRLGSYHAIATADEARQALATGTPVMITVPVNAAFDATGSDGVLSAAALACRDFNHAVLMVGYTEYWAVVQNSWSEQWGNQGWFYFPLSAWGDGFVGEAWTASLRVTA